MSIELRTVDQFVEYYLGANYDDVLEVSSTLHCICNKMTQSLLTVLRLESNKPSKYDLMIVRISNKLYTSSSSNIHDILEIYKNRKVIQ